MVLVEVASVSGCGSQNLCLTDNTTVRTLKKLIRKNTGVPCNQQKLIFCGKTMEDERSLESYDLPRSGSYGKVYFIVNKTEGGDIEGEDYSDEEANSFLQNNCTIM